jgi:hypothetical protein
MNIIRGTLLAVCLCAALAASTSTATGAKPKPLQCGAPSKLVGGMGQVGPLLFVNVNYENPKRATALVQPGYPTKILLRLRGGQTLKTPLVLRGGLCGTTTKLRFRYGKAFPKNVRFPVTVQELPKLGSTAVTLPATSSIVFQGYMLFTGHGDYKVSVSQGTKLLGSIVIHAVTV